MRLIMGDNTTGGVKHDQNKIRMDLLPWDAVVEIAKIFTFGASKYADRNWEKGFDWSRVYAALQRHLTMWFQGQDKDPETGKSHLAHAGCCLFFLLAFVLRDTGRDDRPKLPDEQLKNMSTYEIAPIVDRTEERVEDLSEDEDVTLYCEPADHVS